ncbi:MAG: restriction endonuclease subunit S [Clostridium sp.]|nr:MAG: restriction endonuclease subunit S [Clostridium sp.]
MNNPAFYPIDCLNYLGEAALNENDLLMSLTGNVGRVAIIDKEMLPAGLNQRVECIRPNEKYFKRILILFFNQKKISFRSN